MLGQNYVMVKLSQVSRLIKAKVQELGHNLVTGSSTKSERER